ncbi:hypothetical protein [Neolewinella aurantiaca]|uniref:hypothetical protein n=1 Tax=Neolewinella aurantiaca TaxID=2602767 RepID=UPI00164FA793|nr:hypothetical protein [Neolewinella aurantiaca]
MDTILDQLTPDTIAYLETIYGSIANWVAVASDWAAEQWDALGHVVNEDIHL